MYRLEIERLLAESPIVRSTDLRIEDEDDTIKIFGRLLFVDGSLLYFFEYHALGELRQYMFHWQTREGDMIARFGQCTAFYQHNDVSGSQAHTSRCCIIKAAETT